MKVIIAGSRSIKEMSILEEVLEGYNFSSTDEIVSGSAKGVDTLAEIFANIVGHNLKVFPADWSKGLSAGYKRNAEMAEYADAAILVWDGKSSGTLNMYEQMLRLDKPVVVYEVFNGKVRKLQMSIDKKYQEGYVRMVIPNAILYWAKVFKPDTEFGKNEWCVDIAITDEVLAEALRKEGFRVEDKEYKSVGKVKDVLKAKRQVVRKDGTKQEPPKVWYPDAVTPFDKEIGNGTVANVKISARAWKISGRWVLSAYVEEIQIVDHKEYSGGASFTPITPPF